MQSRNNPVRMIGLDILKVIAVLFVIVLHTNGYTAELNSITNYSTFSKYVYYFLEALAYPAIHIFVLIGSYFMVQKSPTIKSFIRLYSQTITVCVLGLIFALVLVRSEITLGGVLSCIFPFSQRAYWFVSDYLVLLMLAPFLNMLLEKMSKKMHFSLIMILFLVVAVLPFASVNAWEKSNLLLFILLYIIAGYIHKIGIVGKGNQYRWMLNWILMVFVLFGSAVLVNSLSSRFSSFAGREMMLYQYFSPIVVMEGVSIFLFFICKPTVVKSELKVIKWVCSTSLIIYMLHMHPIIKQLYTKYAALRFIPVDSGPMYFLAIIGLAFVVAAVGSIVGNIIVRPIANYVSRIMGNVVNHVLSYIKKKEKSDVQS